MWYLSAQAVTQTADVDGHNEVEIVIFDILDFNGVCLLADNASEVGCTVEFAEFVDGRCRSRMSTTWVMIWAPVCKSSVSNS
jgi:hypothetical protein